jgi:uncharacterized protein (DUF1697 family)
MATYVGLLRAVNLGGSTQLRMSDLSALLSRNGFGQVRTLLQSGNVVFRSDARDPVNLERSLEQLVSNRFGLTTDIFVRSAVEWHQILAQNPFPREAEDDPAHLVVTVLKRTPTVPEWDALRSAIPGRERVEGVGRQAYIVYPDGIGTSKLTAALIERKLSTRGTSRNWNTARKLDQLVAS